MFRDPHRIQRNYNRRFFSQRANYARLYFIVIMIVLIFMIPFVAFSQRDSITLAALDVVGMMPTATPFASEYANLALVRYNEQGDLRGALALFEESIRLQPNNANYLYEYGRLLIELERSTEASEVGDRIIAIAPDDPRGYALKANTLVWSDPAAAIPIAIAGSELGVPYAPLDAALAIAYTNIGRYAEALQRGDRAIRIDPQSASARRAYSYPLIFTGNFTEAIRQLEQAVIINPRLTGPYFELASLYRRLGQEEMAVGIYNRILEIEPANARAFLRLCETYAAVGRFQEAQPFCERSLAIDPEYASAYRMLGQLQYSRRNYESAIDSFRQCIALGSVEVECYYIRGLAHYYLGHCDDAWDVLTESLSYTVQQPIIDAINSGLSFVTRNCAGYQGQQLPTPIPPTPIPPTPIGGGY